MSNKYEFHSNPWDTISPTAKDLIKRCLTKNPKERITPTDALMHPWIAHTNNLTNFLPHVFFENLRKNIKSLSRRKIYNLSTNRSKSGDGDEIYGVYQEMDEKDDGDYIEEEDVVVEEEVGRRAISYAEEINNVNFFQFNAKKKLGQSNLLLDEVKGGK